MITQRALQQDLAQAAVDLLFKRKDRHTHDDDASTLASVQEAGTNKGMFFPTMKAQADRSRKALGPPALHNARGGERFDPATLLGRRMPQSDLCANPANKSSLPAASYAEKEWTAVTTGVNMRTSVQDDFLSVTKSSSFLTKELLPQVANMLQQFRDELERNMNEPRPDATPRATNDAATSLNYHTPTSQQLAHSTATCNSPPPTNSKGLSLQDHANRSDKRSLIASGWPG